MSIVRVNKEDVQTFTLVTTPSRTYTSSSISGSTGSVKVFPRRSQLEKDTDETSVFNDTRQGAHVDSNFETQFKSIIDKVSAARAGSAPIVAPLENYLTLVNGTQVKKREILDVDRFTPTTRFTKYTLRKNHVKEVLMPYYKAKYQHSDWIYTNYNTLNFFTAVSGSPAVQVVPTGSALLYPNSVDSEVHTEDGYTSGSYCLSGAFSFDFHINPRYNVDGTDGTEFRAGTILHLSSSYALSLITGSKRDINGNLLGFRLQLQLSKSADVMPSAIAPVPYPGEFIYFSDDNSLLHNQWHHVVIRWGTNNVNDGTGSFIVNGMNRGNFVIPSGTISSKAFTLSGNPDMLCVGNFYEGINNSIASQNLFFNTENARRDGVDQLTLVPSVGYEGPGDSSYIFSHPLKAEIHDLSIRRYFMNDLDVQSSMKYGPGLDAFDKKKFAFYLPPLFVEDTPIRRWVGDRGGILQTPFFEIDGSTDDPFNVAMAFGVNGHYINLENFTKDFTTGRFPRLLQLSASAIDYTTDAQEANYFLYKQPGVVKRNLSVLPCDDGTFEQNYAVLGREDYQNKFADSSGTPNYSYINLDQLVAVSSILTGGIHPDSPDDYVTQLYGANPENPGLPPGSAYQAYIAAVTASINSISQDEPFNRGIQKGAPLTIYQRTLDPSSNQITFFNISNLYYGSRIYPGSFKLVDTNLTGSNGTIKITIQDDGAGNLYRADSNGKHATQNSVGNIFYDEGIVLIKSPHLYFFGKEQYEMSFRGVHNVHTTKYEILAASGLHNSSSNITYTSDLKASGDPQDTSPFVYISGMYFHDENMNVVAKAKFAQPIIKREEDKILFRVGFDF